MLAYTTGSTIINVNASYNCYGIALIYSSNNDIIHNRISYIEFGAPLAWSSDDTFYYNKFINNTIQVKLEDSLTNV